LIFRLYSLIYVSILVYIRENQIGCVPPRILWTNLDVCRLEYWEQWELTRCQFLSTEPIWKLPTNIRGCLLSYIYHTLSPYSVCNHVWSVLRIECLVIYQIKKYCTGKSIIEYFQQFSILCLQVNHIGFQTYSLHGIH